MISVRRARVLPLPSFRFRLTTDTLGFGYDLPAAGRSRDFHPLERALAGRTMGKRPEATRLRGALLLFSLRLICASGGGPCIRGLWLGHFAVRG